MKIYLPVICIFVAMLFFTLRERSKNEFDDGFSHKFSHPDLLKFAEFDWQLPNGNDFRATIGNIPFFYENDNLVPLFHFQLSFEAGTMLEYPQPKGTSQLYALSIRNGGGRKFSPAQVDSLLALNAVSISVANTQARTDFVVSGLSQNLPVALEILEDILQNPAFDQARLRLNRTTLTQGVNHRFDNPSSLLVAGWRSIIYPQTSVSELLPANFPQRITQNYLMQYHRYLMNDSRMIVAASGDIDEGLVRDFIERNFGKERAVNSRTIPEISPEILPQTLVIHRDGLTQSLIATGFVSFMRPDDRFYPLSVFNEILGGGFNSRLVSRIRSDEGLTYSIHSQLGSNYLFPATFNAQMTTQIEHTNRALALMREIVENTAKEELANGEVNEKIEQFILALPSAFRTSEARVTTFLRDEFDGRSPTHYIDYVKRMRAITSADVALTARNFFENRAFFTVVVTDTSALKKVPAHEDFSIENLNPIILTVAEFERNFGRIE